MVQKLLLKLCYLLRVINLQQIHENALKITIQINFLLEKLTACVDFLLCSWLGCPIDFHFLKNIKCKLFF